MSGLGHDAAGQPAGAAGNGFMGYDRLTSLAMIKDGASNTIALMETRYWPRAVGTRRPIEPARVRPRGCAAPRRRSAVRRTSERRMHAAMVDGSVRFHPLLDRPEEIGRRDHHRRRRTGRPGLSIAVRYRILTTVLRWLAVVLILRVLAAILANYPDYFPPNFDSLFLQGREATFTGLYRPAFYVTSFPARSCCSTG